jgi:hypothetical protein
MTRVLPVEEAVALVRPADSLGFGLGPANPDAFLTALGTRDDWEDLQVGGALCLNYYEVFTKSGVSYRCADPRPVRPPGDGGPGRPGR